MSRGALYVSNSGNSKLSGKGSPRIDTTYASIKATCGDCELKQTGTCYAKSSYVGLVVKRLDRRARQYSPLQVARAEAAAIDSSYRGGKVPEGRCLRVHTSGDSRTRTGTRIIARAVERWKARGGGLAFTYTHSFAHVHRSYWGSVSVLASIEKISQVAEARKQGYSPALVVAEHASSKAYKLPDCDITWIPCPAQTKPAGKDVSCVECKLCMKGDWLFATNRGISFAAHGVKQNSLKKHLTVIQ